MPTHTNSILATQSKAGHPSQGAARAAMRILKYVTLNHGTIRAETIADIVNEETSAPELLAALKALSVAVRDAGKTGTAGNLARAEDQARAAILRATEGSK